MKFVDRNMELGLLGELNGRAGAQLVVLYGRRRIGKTRLLSHWLGQQHAHHFYWMATQTSTTNQLRGFSQALLSFLQPGVRLDPTFSYASWGAAFDVLQQVAQDERLIVVIDEFTYLLQADAEIASLLQRSWDHGLKNSQIFLILTGSLAGMIERHILDYQAPLYGRASGRLRLNPLPFGALRQLLPGFRSQDRVAVYAVAGGIPAYLELFDDQLSLAENLRQRIVSPANLMMGDAIFLLNEQLDEPRNYMAIIESIAAGNRTLTAVANMAGISRTNIVKYLGVLQELGYVQRQVPATVRRPERSRKGRYTITDPYMRFYFRFLHPNLSFIERGMRKQAALQIHDNLPNFIGAHTFEELCQEWVMAQGERGELPFLPERVGGFWSQQVQVDILALNWQTRDILLGECKWQNRKMTPGMLRGLQEKAAAVIPGKDWNVHYALFSRKTFSEPFRAAAAALNTVLVPLDRLEEDLYTWVQGDN